MKKLTIGLLSGCVLFGLSFSCLAASKNPCVKSTNWAVSKKFHYQPTYTCQNVKCVLNDRSGGTINQKNPSKSTYWEKVDWTLLNKTNDAVIATGQCQKVPPVSGSQYCYGTANGAITCAYQYSKQLKRMPSVKK